MPGLIEKSFFYGRKGQVRDSLLVLLVMPSLISAGTCRFFTFSTYEDWASGTTSGVEIWSDGGLSRAARMDSVLLEDEQYVWDLCPASGGGVYIATGGNGRAYLVKEKDVSIVFDSPESDVLSILQDENGDLWLGCSPDGLIYRVGSAASDIEEFRTGQGSVWCLAGFEGGIVAGTGPEGKIFYLESGKEAEEIAETASANVMSLLALGDGELLAAGESPGVVQRVGQDGDVFTIARLDFEEVRSICSLRRDSIAVIALGPVSGSGKNRTSVLVGEIRGPLENVWASPDSLLLDLTRTDRGLIAVGGWPGRAYSVGRDGTFGRIAEIDGAQIICATASEGRLYLGSGSPACLYWLEEGRVKVGEWKSPVLDAENVAQWGIAKWTGPQRGKLKLYARSGNLGEPDYGWSEWTEARFSKDGWDLSFLPDARFLQAKLELGSGERQEIEEGMTLFEISYLPRNREPELSKLKFLPKGKKPPGVYSRYPTSTSSISRTSSTNKEKKEGPKPQGKTVETHRYLSWEAKDPDGDRLLYSVSFKRYPDGDWVKMADELEERYFAVAEGSLAEGLYAFKLEVSDEADNPVERARTSLEILSPVLIDEAPPRAGKVTWKSGANGWEVEVEVEDSGSGLVQAAVSIDGQRWRIVEPEDGIADSNKEKFIIEVGENHGSISLRLKDRAGNVVSASLNRAK